MLKLDKFQVMYQVLEKNLPIIYYPKWNLLNNLMVIVDRVNLISLWIIHPCVEVLTKILDGYYILTGPMLKMLIGK